MRLLYAFDCWSLLMVRFGFSFLLFTDDFENLGIFILQMKLYLNFYKFMDDLLQAVKNVGVENIDVVCIYVTFLNYNIIYLILCKI